ncbi:hypothetical protein BCR41DRAFT_354905 [Lobosporangium transversale]|uniref:Secreted protein n=1 Tax=Lobosporangium transversale TaxID=64571 RepID=A0A1Y2GNT8_9FUNG|nr:hypothetical protein BCR41DRAFT_354905 [Lobosporangium transversale]ORZ14456.1 hypothetical protein BCR41DRAFT_354905 [Lobosporangium transversale]|eukprot:XP_021880934.1 hypothetical protein BCR41DRAFT_354905 [Lobosporangium transversale]
MRVDVVVLVLWTLFFWMMVGPSKCSVPVGLNKRRGSRLRSLEVCLQDHSVCSRKKNVKPGSPPVRVLRGTTLS